MFAHALLSPEGLTHGLIHRRLKWHVCEYNRIQASRASFDEEARKLALKALDEHRGAVMECEALLRGEEPDYGSEREITERYLDIGTPEEDLALGLA